MCSYLCPSGNRPVVLTLSSGRISAENPYISPSVCFRSSCWWAMKDPRTQSVACEWTLKDVHRLFLGRLCTACFQVGIPSLNTSPFFKKTHTEGSIP